METCADGKWVYLTRPTFLNKGFDFQINVEDFGRERRRKRKNATDRPSHDDIFRDLRRKIRSHPRVKEELFRAISDVYDCKDTDRILRRRPLLRTIREGLPVDKALRIIKWFFVEQDLTYWNGTGRNMFMCAIENKVFGMRSKLKE